MGRCPRCHANMLFVEYDGYEWVKHCLACAETRNLQGREIKSPFTIGSAGRHGEQHTRKFWGNQYTKVRKVC